MAELATAITGGSAGTALPTSYEVAVAIDLSDAVDGSMLAEIKLAMRDLVDIIVWTRQSTATARVAIVPFADTVSPGLDLRRFTGDQRPGTCATPGCQRFSFQARDTTRCGAASPATANCATRVFAAGHCVAERSAAEPFTDASPLVSHLPVAYPSGTGQCSGVGQALPLTADVEALRSSIASLANGGKSSPQLGIAWAWYMLSPEWTYLWPADSRPADYAELALRTSGNKPKLRKIAILVQSAHETVQRCQGVDDRIIACNAPNGTAIEQTRRLCDAIRRTGIAIYVVGIGIEGHRELDAVLRNNCAGREDSFYAVRSGSELRQAFRDIALQISPAMETN